MSSKYIKWTHYTLGYDIKNKIQPYQSRTRIAHKNYDVDLRLFNFSYITWYICGDIQSPERTCNSLARACTQFPGTNEPK